MKRLAVVGCAEVARRYTDVAARIGTEFVAAVNPHLGTARRMAAELGASISATCVDDLVSGHAADFDAVLIHSANCLHQQQALQAIRAGKHTLVEIPLALSTVGVDELLSAAEQASVRLMLGQAWRFLPSVQTVRQKLVGGQLGQPGLVRIHRWEGRTTGDRIQQQEHEQRQGGTLRGALVRDIDLATWLLERRPQQVFAVGRNLAESAGDRTWDYVQLHLGCDDGAMAVIDYCGTLPPGDGYYSLSVIGSTGAAYADDHHNMQLLYRGGSPTALKTAQGNQHILAELQEFLAAIEESREPSSSGRAGRRVVQVAEAAEESIATGQAIRLT